MDAADSVATRTRQTPTERAMQTAAAGRAVANRVLTRGEENLAYLAHIEAEERAKGGCELAGHRWLADGTCNFCAARQDQLRIEGAA